jgi:chromosome segregation ATPase
VSIEDPGGGAAGPGEDQPGAPDRPQPSGEIAPESQPSEHHRNPWIWISVALAVIAIGLLVSGLKTQSDLDDANQQVKDLQAQISKGKTAGGAAAVSFKAAYDDLEKQLGATNADLASTQQDLQAAEQDAAKAQQDAAAAKQKASQSGNATDKANAEAEQAKAEAKAAESQTAIVTDCANTYLTALGSLVQSDNPSKEAATVKKELQSISNTCKKALEGP